MMMRRVYEEDKAYQEKQILEGYYKELFDSETDVFDKLLAVDYLSHYASDNEHRIKLKHLYNREENMVVKEALEQVLNGKYQAIDYSPALYDEDLKSIMDESKKSQINENKRISQENTELIKFLKFKH